jgi:hypothetical protein
MSLSIRDFWQLHRLRNQRVAPKIVEQTSPTSRASSKNFRFFLVTLGSGSSGLGLEGITVCIGIERK